jgi:hypothetical protein
MEYENEDDPIALDGFVCTNKECGHFMKFDNDENIFFHNALPYCEDCYADLGIYPSETFWNTEDQLKAGWILEDQFLGEDSDE